MIAPASRWAVRAAHLVYVLGLSVVTEGLALLTLGLVRPWGERFPRRLVLALAGFGVISLALLWGYAFRNFPNVDKSSTPCGSATPGACSCSSVTYRCCCGRRCWRPSPTTTRAEHARRSRSP